MAGTSEPDAWPRAAELFDRLADLPAEARERELDAVRRVDPALSALVARMLASDAAAGGLLGAGLANLAHLAAADEPLPPGTRVGDFELLRELGHGGMGVVYEARDVHLGRIAAVKLLPARPGPAAPDADPLLREARAASALDHPNVATIYQAGRAADGRRFLAMARYEGETLRDRLLRGPVSVAEALDVAIQVARGLGAAHAAGIVHRDVKPENVFLTRAGPVKLLDFGVAGVPGRGDGAVLHGTPAYMSPEALRGGRADARSDVWSLGVVLREMLGPEAAARRGARRLAAVADRACAPDPEGRFADGAQFTRALLASRRGVGTGWRVAAGLAAATLLAGTAVFASRGAGRERPAAIAVGAIAGPEAGGLASLIADRLAGVQGIEVVAPERLEDLRAQLAAAGHPDSARGRAVARLAGAGTLFEGELQRSADGRFALGLVRVALPGGRARALDPLLGGSPAAVVDAAVLAIAAELGLPAPDPAGVPSRSVLASRLYEEGLRAHHAGNPGIADRLLADAVAEDSLHADALLLLWRIRRPVEGEAADTLLARALAIAAQLPRRAQLLVRASWASATLDPAFLALADTLARAFPRDPAARLLRARALRYAGDHRAAIGHLREVIRLDSLSLRGDPATCRACQALAELVVAYDAIDSLGLALDAANEWVRWKPESPAAWDQLAYAMEDLGRDAEALEAHRRAARLAPALASSAIYPGRMALRAGRWQEADRLLADVVEHGHPAAQRQARWFLAISQREQGRLREALETERGRIRAANDLDDGDPPPPSLLQGQILLELGRYREAAAVFRALDRAAREARFPGRVARGRSWPLIQLASVLGAAGDTAALAEVVDTLAGIGPRSLFRRDQVGHHYARGILHRLRGHPDSAVAELRRAVLSPGNDYSRVNLELGRALLAIGRPHEAMATLEAALPGMLESVHLYVSRAELRETLGRAAEAAARPDLAAEHYRWAAAAWARADPELRGRGEASMAALVRLSGGAP